MTAKDLIESIIRDIEADLLDDKTPSSDADFLRGF
jgi:hypothetical protein